MRKQPGAPDWVTPSVVFQLGDVTVGVIGSELESLNVSVGGASRLATLFDQEVTALGQPALLLAGGDNVGASPPNSGLLEDMPAIDVENAWGLDATSYGNHEFDYGVERLLRHQGGHLLEAATGGVASGDVEVDLRRATGPARLGLADRLPGRSGTTPPAAPAAGG